MPAKIDVRKPLFDRLVDHDPHGIDLRPMRTLDRGGLRESVRKELEHLFNTRCSLPSNKLTVRERSVIDYGIPDFSTFYARRYDDRQRLAEVLRKAIVAYEPRLSDVRVRVEPVPGDDLVLEAHIEANLLVGTVAEPVAFTTVLQDEMTVVAE